MFLVRFIDVRIFLWSLAIGFFFVYLYGSDIKPIYIYPTPENVNQYLFKDQADNCFAFEMKETTCPSDTSKIKNIPVQHQTLFTP